MSTANTFGALRAHALAPLRAWMDDHASEVDAVIASVRPFVAVRKTFAGEAMSYDDAIRWSLDSARHLVDNTFFDEASGKMEKDATGASGSTHVPLKNYAAAGEVAPLPVDVHAAAIETMRIHSGRQLDRAEWQSAHNAIMAELAREEKAPAGKVHIHSVTKSPDSFKDGAFDFDKDRGPAKAIRLTFLRRKGFPSLFEMLRAGRFPRDAYMFGTHESGDKKGKTDYQTIFVPPEYADAIADYIEEAFPLMAAALRQNAPIWRAALGMDAKAKSVVEKRVDVFNADKGNVDGNFWMASRDGSGVMLWPQGAVLRWLRPHRGDDGYSDRKQGLEFVAERIDRATGKEKSAFWSIKFWGMHKFIDALRTRAPALADAWSQVYADKLTVKAPEYGDRPGDCQILRELARAGSVDEIADPEARRYAIDVGRDLARALPRGLTPLPFQAVGVAYAKASDYRCIIGDQPGLGKTIQALGSIALDPDELLPALVLCPSSLLLNWQKEAAVWTPGVPTWVVTTRKSALPPRGWRGLVITSWALLDNYVSESDPSMGFGGIGLRCIIADESQKAKEWSTGWSVALRLLAKTVPHLLELSGTPEKNRVMELWHQLYLLAPTVFREMKEFGARFTHVTEQPIGHGRTVTKYDGSKNEAAFQRMTACWMVRRLKSDVLTQLPPKTRTVVPVAIDERYLASYEKAESDFEAWLKKEMARKVAEMIASGEITVQDVDHKAAEIRARVIRALKAKIPVQMGAFRRILGMAKVPAALEWIETKVDDEDEPVVVFAEHKNVIDALAAGLDKAKISYVVVDGRTPIKERQTAKEDFQAGRVDVFIGSQAAKEGITLTRAANTLFLERWWTPGDEEQAEDRIHRISQERPVTIWYMQVPGTFDDDMADMIATKRHVLAKTIGESEVLEGEPNEATLEALMERYARGDGKRATRPAPRENPRGMRLNPPRHVYMVRNCGGLD